MSDEEKVEKAEDTQPTCIYAPGHEHGAANATHHKWGKYHSQVVPANEAAKLVKSGDWFSHPEDCNPAKDDKKPAKKQ